MDKNLNLVSDVTVVENSEVVKTTEVKLDCHGKKSYDKYVCKTERRNSQEQKMNISEGMKRYHAIKKMIKNGEEIPEEFKEEAERIKNKQPKKSKGTSKGTSKYVKKTDRSMSQATKDKIAETMRLKAEAKKLAEEEAKKLAEEQMEFAKRMEYMIMEADEVKELGEELDILIEAEEVREFEQIVNEME